MIDRILPEPDAKIVGYAYLVQSYELRVPLPIILSTIGKKHTIYEVDGWKVYTPRHAPKESFL
ncbi:MAG: hypothetical protein OXC57_05840 [Rhodobacteraceae bacterium]|nr:hypothetical protein [Paracoccaceae bacterium]